MLEEYNLSVGRGRPINQPASIFTIRCPIVPSIPTNPALPSPHPTIRSLFRKTVQSGFLRICKYSRDTAAIPVHTIHHAPELRRIRFCL